MGKYYSIKIDYSPAYELVISFYTYIYHKKIKFISLGKDWVTKTRDMLPEKFALMLEDERWEVLHRMVLLISQCPQKEDAFQFLSWLEHLPAGEIYERLAPWVTSIPLNLGDIRDRTLYLLTEWNEHYFRYVDADIFGHLQTDFKKRQQQLQAINPIDLIEDATNGIRIEPTDQLQEVILIPQYHCSPATVFDYFRGMATCLYPCEEASTRKDQEVENLLDQLQCLADGTRLHMLKFLAEKPRTLIEIHQHLNMAKSTIHHHITILRRSGLIRSHFFDHTTPSYYSLRQSAIHRFHTELNNLLF
ncbi:ArsR/SmtB family transcription factor [Thermoflavimicrobium daqui]|nr:ArsR family transcriptional regulator [Thermoflavimicrobium daqui]